MANVYQVGVHLMLQNGVSAGLQAIIGQLTRANAAATTLNATLGRTRLAAAGVASILGGVAIFEGMAKLVAHGKNVNDQLERMKLAGMSYKEIQDSIVQAQRTSSNVMTTTYSENLKHLLELRYAFGDTEKAIHHLDEVSKANAILNAMNGGGKDQVWEFVKALEGKGLTNDPKAFSEYLNAMTQVVEATGGRITPQMYYGNFKYGRTATNVWDMEFVRGALPRLMQELGGGSGAGSGSAGNALMSGFAKLVTGAGFSKVSGREMEALGIGKAEKVPGTNSVIGHMPDASTQLFGKNPYEWVQQVLGPALMAKGITDDVKVAASIQRLIGNRTIADALFKFWQQGRFHGGENAPYEKDIRLNKGAMPLEEGAKEATMRKYDVVMKEFHAQWERLMETLGGPVVEAVIPIIKSMADAFKQLGEIAAAHPQAVKTAMEVLAGLAGGLIVGGIIALGAALISLAGPIGLISTAIVGAVAVITTTNLGETLKSFFLNMQQSIITGCQNAVSAAVAAIPGIFAAIGPAIINGIKGAIGNLGGMFKGHTDYPGNPGEGGAPPAHPMNYRSAPPKQGGMQSASAVYLDGRKVGDVVTKNMVRMANSPTQGAVYPDGTRTDWRTDTTYLHA